MMNNKALATRGGKVDSIYCLKGAPSKCAPNQFPWGRESKRCQKLHASFGDIHTCCYQNNNNYQLSSPPLSLYFKILVSLHISCIPSLSVFRMSNFTHNIWGRKRKHHVWLRKNFKDQLYIPWPPQKLCCLTHGCKIIGRVLHYYIHCRAFIHLSPLTD